MSDSYSAIGQALFDYTGAITISAAFPEPGEGEEAQSWGTKLNRPAKADELNTYPAFAVLPARDTQETGDTEIDLDAITYSVFIIFSNREGTASEAQIRSVVDIVRTKFRELRYNPAPLLASAYNIAFSGEWGGTPEQGERWYRLDVTVFVHETLVVADT